ncbi:hypothetical protein WME75_16590 [Sorangium sp. So ce1014]|uniref:hypothetical protein n=1 Tax=Sorangium sp. So ce1014 TaxID=3133326 RepID=UPI003F63A65A
MKCSAGALGIVVGVGLFTAACGSASQLEGELEGPGLEVMWGKPGTQDPNGTPKHAWHTWKEPLVGALKRPLLQSDHTFNPEIVDVGFLDDPEGEEVFDHAFRCAVAKDTVVIHGDREYKGRGAVIGASGWVNGGLEMDVIYNVLECVIAFVNDKTDGVDVLLTGANMNDDKGDHDGFIYSEAVWCANVVPPGFVGVEVYATESFEKECGYDIEEALKRRYCYQEGSCGLEYMGLVTENSVCEPIGPAEDGHYRCKGKPCTMTWLKNPKPHWCERDRRPRLRPD